MGSSREAGCGVNPLDEWKLNENGQILGDFPDE